MCLKLLWHAQKELQFFKVLFSLTHNVEHIMKLWFLNYNMSRVMRKPTFWFPTRSDTNQAVQLQQMDRGLKFWIKKVEELYYLCNENKGADQLHGYREADLRLCFLICKMLVFSWRGSYVICLIIYKYLEQLFFLFKIFGLKMQKSTFFEEKKGFECCFIELRWWWLQTGLADLKSTKHLNFWIG